METCSGIVVLGTGYGILVEGAVFVMVVVMRIVVGARETGGYGI